MIRPVISIAIVGLLGAATFFGTYQPLRKSLLYEQAVRGVSSVRNPAQFVRLFVAPLDASSPIGHGEVVRGTTAIVLNLVQKQSAPPYVVVALRNFVEERFAPIDRRGKGIGYAQTLYNVGAINVIAYLRTANPAYLDAAHKYFSRGLTESPGRAEFLYGLMDVYRLAGDKENFQSIAKAILQRWPDDENTRAALAGQLEKRR